MVPSRASALFLRFKGIGIFASNFLDISAFDYIQNRYEWRPFQYSGACPQVGGSCTLPGAGSSACLFSFPASLSDFTVLWNTHAASSDLVASKGECSGFNDWRYYANYFDALSAHSVFLSLCGILFEWLRLANSFFTHESTYMNGPDWRAILKATLCSICICLAAIAVDGISLLNIDVACITHVKKKPPKVQRISRDWVSSCHKADHASEHPSLMIDLRGGGRSSPADDANARLLAGLAALLKSASASQTELRISEWKWLERIAA